MWRISVLKMRNGCPRTKEYREKGNEGMRDFYEDVDDEMEIDLLELFYALKQRILIILLVGILGGGAAYGVTEGLMTPLYTSTTSMLVLTKETTLASLADLQMGSQLTNDYEVLITSRPVLEEVIETLNLNMDYKELESQIAISNPSDTRILEISVTNPSAQMAQKIVNELAQVSADFIGDKMEVVPPKVIDEGIVPEHQTSPSLTKNVLIGIFLGLLLSGGIVCVRTIMDDTIKSEDDIDKYLGLPMLASVPDRKDFINGKKKSKAKKNSSRSSDKKAKKR